MELSTGIVPKQIKAEAKRVLQQNNIMRKRIQEKNIPKRNLNLYNPSFSHKEFNYFKTRSKILSLDNNKFITNNKKEIWDIPEKINGTDLITTTPYNEFKSFSKNIQNLNTHFVKAKNI